MMIIIHEVEATWRYLINLPSTKIAKNWVVDVQNSLQMHGC